MKKYKKLGITIKKVKWMGRTYIIQELDSFVKNSFKLKSKDNEYNNR